MKRHFVLASVYIWVLGFSQVGFGQDAVLSDPGTHYCDFSEYRRLVDPHPLFKAAHRKVEPKYPAAARSVGSYGKVIVRILVDTKGDVVKACVVSGPPLLGIHSIKAARQWKFKKNFGFTHYRLKERFAETEIDFNFRRP